MPPIEAMTGIVPLIPKPEGNGELLVVLASLWSVQYGVLQTQRCSGPGRNRFWNTGSSFALRVEWARLCKDEVARDMGRAVIGMYLVIEQFYDSISPRHVMNEMGKAGFGQSFLQ